MTGFEVDPGDGSNHVCVGMSWLSASFASARRFLGLSTANLTVLTKPVCSLDLDTPNDQKERY